jgi:hypothetical protein
VVLGERDAYRDYLEKRIISIVYGGGRKDFLSLYFGGLSPLIRRGLVTYGKRRLYKRREIAKLILMRGIH